MRGPAFEFYLGRWLSRSMVSLSLLGLRVNPHILRNESPHLVIASEAWQLPNRWFRLFKRRHLGTRDCHVGTAVRYVVLLAMTRKRVCQRWIVLFLCLKHCHKTTYEPIANSLLSHRLCRWEFTRLCRSGVVIFRFEREAIRELFRIASVFFR